MDLQSCHQSSGSFSSYDEKHVEDDRETDVDSRDDDASELSIDSKDEKEVEEDEGKQLKEEKKMKGLSVKKIHLDVSWDEEKTGVEMMLEEIDWNTVLLQW